MPSNQKRSNFTLIELLVVVAILAILMAMLMPALARAKFGAKRTACAAQQKQLLIGAYNFAADNNRVLPEGRRDNGGEHCVWIATETHDAMASLPPSTPASHANGEKPDDLWVCPSIGPAPFYFQAGTGWVVSYNYLGNHPLASTQGATAAERWFSARRLGDPSDSVLLNDLNTWSPGQWTTSNHVYPTGRFFPAAAGGGGSPVNLGSEGGNLGYLDGSVSWKRITDMSRYATSSGGGMPGLW